MKDKKIIKEMKKIMESSFLILVDKRYVHPHDKTHAADLIRAAITIHNFHVNCKLQIDFDDYIHDRFSEYRDSEEFRPDHY